jgi:hypothetical protein
MKTSTARKVWIVLAVSIVFHFHAIAQNMIANGGFNTDATGWSETNNSPLGGYRCCKGNPEGLFWLDSSPSPTNDPTISQVVTA